MPGRARERGEVMAGGVSVVIFEGTAPASTVEEELVRVRRAALLDNLVKFRGLDGPVEAIYLVTNDPLLAAESRHYAVQVILNKIHPASFHFGRALQELVCRNGLQRVFYLGGAGCPLISAEEIAHICHTLLGRERFVYTNNTQSADIVAFTVPEGLDGVDLPSMDNALATTLRDSFDLEMELMPCSPGLLFDLDTPADALVLKAGPFGGPRTRAVLDSLDWDCTRLDRAKQALSGFYQDVALVGRVGAPIMERLNSALKVRLRVFSEERGMKALGRLAAGEVVSLIGFLVERVGLADFFTYLSRVARCAFIDSRVLMAHHRYDIQDRDRFRSDLGLWQEVEHPWLREFTREAARCSIPVILGGHSLIAGSLWALSCELAPEGGEGTGPET